MLKLRQSLKNISYYFYLKVHSMPISVLEANPQNFVAYVRNYICPKNYKNINL